MTIIYGKAGDELTAKQLAVTMLAVKGFTYREIGGMLFISPFTVAQHIKEAYARTNTDSRAELTLWAVQRGLIGAPALPDDARIGALLTQAGHTPGDVISRETLAVLRRFVQLVIADSRVAA